MVKTNIYFISDNEYVKIGRSKNVEKRIGEIQTGNPNSLQVKYIIRNVSINFEKHLHDICQRFHVKGEWFTFNVMKFLFNISSIEKLLIKYD